MDRDIRPTLTPELEKKLGDIVKDLESSRGMAVFWDEVVKGACRALSADAGTFFELSDDKGSLKVVASYGVLPSRLSQAEFPLGKGICGWIARNRQAVCVNEVASDTRFNKEVDVLTDFKTFAVLGAPVAMPKILPVRQKGRDMLAPLVRLASRCY